MGNVSKLCKLPLLDRLDLDDLLSEIAIPAKLCNAFQAFSQNCKSLFVSSILAGACT